MLCGTETDLLTCASLPPMALLRWGSSIRPGAAAAMQTRGVVLGWRLLGRVSPRGFLLKDTDTDLLLHAINAAAAGDALIAPNITGRLLARFADAARDNTEPAVALTDRERDILAAVARGDTNAEIGQALHLSLSSVKAHIGRLMDKIGARNRVQIAIWAHQTGQTDH